MRAVSRWPATPCRVWSGYPFFLSGGGLLPCPTLAPTYPPTALCASGTITSVTVRAPRAWGCPSCPSGRSSRPPSRLVGPRKLDCGSGGQAGLSALLAASRSVFFSFFRDEVEDCAARLARSMPPHPRPQTRALRGRRRGGAPTASSTACGTRGRRPSGCRGRSRPVRPARARRRGARPATGARSLDLAGRALGADRQRQPLPPARLPAARPRARASVLGAEALDLDRGAAGVTAALKERHRQIIPVAGIGLARSDRDLPERELVGMDLDLRRRR